MEINEGHQRERSSLFYVKLPFPFKLYEMLEDMAIQGQESIVSWLPHGMAFKVHQPKVFAGSIMPKYFKQSMYKSFQRQLYMYGFCRINDTKAADNFGAYFHPSFTRGNKQITLSMSPTRRRSRRKQVEEGGGVRERRRTQQEGGGRMNESYCGNESMLLLHNSRNGLEDYLLNDFQQKEVHCSSANITTISGIEHDGTKNVEPAFHFSMLESLPHFYLRQTTPVVLQEVTEEESGSIQVVSLCSSPSNDHMNHQYEQSRRLLVDSRNGITISPAGDSAPDNDGEQELGDIFCNTTTSIASTPFGQLYGGRRRGERDLFDFVASSFYQNTKNSDISRILVFQKEVDTAAELQPQQEAKDFVQQKDKESGTSEISSPAPIIISFENEASLVQLLSNDARVTAKQQEGTSTSVTNVVTSSTSGAAIDMTLSSSYVSEKRQSPICQFLRQKQQQQQSLLQKYQCYTTKSSLETFAIPESSFGENMGMRLGEFLAFQPQERDAEVLLLEERFITRTKTTQASSTTTTTVMNKRSCSDIEAELTTCLGFEGKKFYSIENECIDFILC